jgi:Holliday junction resolvase RusA-like endonuclease
VNTSGLHGILTVMVLTFTLLGKPESKGAHTSFVPKRKDGSYATWANGRPKVVTKDSNPNQVEAEQLLSAVARQARDAAGWPLTEDPVVVRVTCLFARSKKHYGSGRNATVLKDTAPLYPVTKADVDKLARHILDSLTGSVIKDDKQVIDLSIVKRYVEDDEQPRTTVEVEDVAQSTVGVVVAADQLALAAA